MPPPCNLPFDRLHQIRMLALLVSHPRVPQPQNRRRRQRHAWPASIARRRYVEASKSCTSFRMAGTDYECDLQCSSGVPCEQCSTRHSSCIYDLAADQRRKIANQRNIQALAQSKKEVQRHCGECPRYSNVIRHTALLSAPLLASIPWSRLPPRHLTLQHALMGC